MSTPTEPAAQESELRPCICGRNDKGAFAPIWCVGDAQKNLGWHIECFCGWQGPKKESLAEAIAAWNTRAPQPPIPKDAPAPAQDGVEEIRAKLAKFIADQKPTPAAIAKFVNEHMSELYDDGPPPQPTEQPK